MRQWEHFIAIIKKEVQPALGCTEPTSIAYAAAHAARLLGKKPERLSVAVSDNLYKNAMGVFVPGTGQIGMGVFVPGTGQIGLPIAAAVGALGGNPDAGLEVLATVTPAHVKEAMTMIENGCVSIERADSPDAVYCSATAFAGSDSAQVTVQGDHTGIVEERKNGEVIFKKEPAITTNAEGQSAVGGEEINLKAIHEYGLELGRTINEQIKAGILSSDLINNMAACTAAASDARMGGATLPAMSNYGSGNQGITATIPVVKMAEYVKADDEKLARALILSHLGAIYIKSHYPSLSAFCGNTATSSAVAMALVYLNSGTFEQCCMAINNVISDTSGMVCDGAKSTCAMKVHTAAQTAYKCCFLALAGHGVEGQGIVSADVEQTIDNLGAMITKGMQQTDEKIIEIMRKN